MFAAEAGGYAHGLDLVPDHYRKPMECTVAGGRFASSEAWWLASTMALDSVMRFSMDGIQVSFGHVFNSAFVSWRPFQVGNGGGPFHNSVPVDLLKIQQEEARYVIMNTVH